MESSSYVIQSESEPYFLGRPRTDIGPQGDHVTAYGLFEEFIRQLAEDEPVEVFTTILTTLQTLNLSLAKYEDAFDEQIDEVEQEKLERDKKRIKSAMGEIENNIVNAIEKFMTSDEIDEALDSIKKVKLKEKTGKALLGFNQILFDKIAGQAEDIFILIRNRLRYVSFPREGSIPAPKGEGARVSHALSVLRHYNKYAEKIKSEESINEIVQVMDDLFWYPKIPQNKLINLETENEKWEKIRSEKRYNVGTMPRDNNLEILYYVAARHIDTIASCFPALLKNPKLSPQIIDKFINRIANKWKLKKDEHNEFISMVNHLITKKQEESNEQKKIAEEIESVMPGSTIPMVNIEEELEDTTYKQLAFSKEAKELKGESSTKQPTDTSKHTLESGGKKKEEGPDKKRKFQ